MWWLRQNVARLSPVHCQSFPDRNAGGEATLALSGSRSVSQLLRVLFGSIIALLIIRPAQAAGNRLGNLLPA
jgi:hypothetical protein